MTIIWKCFCTAKQDERVSRSKKRRGHALGCLTNSRPKEQTSTRRSRIQARCFYRESGIVQLASASFYFALLLDSLLKLSQNATNLRGVCFLAHAVTNWIWHGKVANLSPLLPPVAAVPAPYGRLSVPDCALSASVLNRCNPTVGILGC